MSIIVIGAGQAGLAVSRELSVRGVEHVVLERQNVGHAWRTQWDSFTFVTPNWTLRLPGSPYEGPDLEGFLPRDEIVAYLERYAEQNRVPVCKGVGVERLSIAGERFRLETTDGELTAETVIACTGSFQRQYFPAALSAVPADLLRGSGTYRNPEQVPPGVVVVVGMTHKQTVYKT